MEFISHLKYPVEQRVSSVTHIKRGRNGEGEEKDREFRFQPLEKRLETIVFNAMHWPFKISFTQDFLRKTMTRVTYARIIFDMTEKSQAHQITIISNFGHLYAQTDVFIQFPY